MVICDFWIKWNNCFLKNGTPGKGKSGFMVLANLGSLTFVLFKLVDLQNSFTFICHSDSLLLMNSRN